MVCSLPIGLALLLVQNQPPAFMTKMVVCLIGPGIKSGSFAALPRTMYRAGEHYARIEDPPHARQRVRKLIIIAEPDAYSVDRSVQSQPLAGRSRVLRCKTRSNSMARYFFVRNNLTVVMSA